MIKATLVTVVKIEIRLIICLLVTYVALMSTAKGITDSEEKINDD